ncbi:hypothetical protein ACOSP7_002627 [Xanthoceras sorbifolium]
MDPSLGYWVLGLAGPKTLHYMTIDENGSWFPSIFGARLPSLPQFKVRTKGATWIAFFCHHRKTLFLSGRRLID